MKRLSFFLFGFLIAICPIIAQEKAPGKDSEILKRAKQNIEKHRKTDFSIQLKGLDRNDLKNIEIDVQQTSHDFLFGCIIFDLVNHGRGPENEEAFKSAFQKLFNFAVFPFYWAGYEVEQGETNKEKIMEVARWCNQNGITTKGHPLVWTHEAGTPRWLNDYSTAETKVLLQKRVEDIVSGCKKEIEIWDVINEVIHTVNWDVAMKENRSGADNRYTGKDLMSDKIDFIDSCFRWAQNANPDAHLIINEFNIVANESSRQQFYEVVEKLMKKGTPVSGLGIQMHEPNQGRYYYSPQQIWDTYNRYAEFNLPLHVTEFIPVSNGDSLKGIYKTGVWTEQEQADFSEMVFTLSFGHPKLASVNWWGFSDKNIWQEGGGLVDDNLEPKPVYRTLDRLINHEWKTNIRGLKPDKRGNISFRGFKGDYQVKIIRNGETLKEVVVPYSEEINKISIDI